MLGIMTRPLYSPVSNQRPPELVFRSERGIEGGVFIYPEVRQALIPRYRDDTPPTRLVAYLRQMREAVAQTPERQMVLDDSLVKVHPGVAEQAGWILDKTWLFSQTDLRLFPYPLDPDSRILLAHETRSPQVLPLIQALGHQDIEVKPPNVLVGLFDENGQAVALGSYGPTAVPGYATTTTFGVDPSRRGQGLGTRMVLNLRSRAAADHFIYNINRVDASNQAVLNILAKIGGATLVATQQYYRQPSRG